MSRMNRQQEISRMKSQLAPTFTFQPLEKEIIPLGANKYEISMAEVDLDQVQLDPNNPRIQYLLQSQSETSPSQEKLLELLWESAPVKDLKRSIAANGGIVEAVILTADGVVIEGNCRVVCYHKLRDDNPDDE